MHKVDDLILLTAQDIVLQHKRQEIIIKQPTINEVALIGEDAFFQALGLFTLDPKPMKEFVSEIEGIESEVREAWVERITLYDYLLFLVSATEDQTGEISVQELLRLVFNLIMPKYNFQVTKRTGEMLLTSTGEMTNIIKIDQELFLKLEAIINQMFVLDHFFQKEVDIKRSKAAQEIADKMAASEKRISELQGETKEGSYLTRLVSILGVHKSLDYLAGLTVYQLHNQFERYNLYEGHKRDVQASMAGAKIEKPVDWYKTI